MPGTSQKSNKYLLNERTNQVTWPRSPSEFVPKVVPDRTTSKSQAAHLSVHQNASPDSKRECFILTLHGLGLYDAAPLAYNPADFNHCLNQNQLQGF